MRKKKIKINGSHYYSSYIVNWILNPKKYFSKTNISSEYESLTIQKQ